MMNNRINEIQRQYMYAVQPVKLFEAQNKEQTQKSPFYPIDRMSESAYNPSHPNVQTSTTAKRLDILG